MSSVPEFLQGIVTDNPAHDFTHNFGKMMVLYRLLGGISGLTISTTHDDVVGFSIEAKTKKEANNVNSYINGVVYTVYGNKYDVSSVCEEKRVQVRISKV